MRAIHRAGRLSGTPILQNRRLVRSSDQYHDAHLLLARFRGLIFFAPSSALTAGTDIPEPDLLQLRLVSDGPEPNSAGIGQRLENILLVGRFFAGSQQTKTARPRNSSSVRSRSMAIVPFRLATAAACGVSVPIRVPARTSPRLTT